MEENHHLLHPLLHNTTTSSTKPPPPQQNLPHPLLHKTTTISTKPPTPPPPPPQNHHLLHPLLSKTTTTTTSTTTNHILDITSNSPSILPRLLFILFIASISLYANQESSKYFNITISNQAQTNSIASKRFDLFYISNDEISRLLLRASIFVENILYPDGIYLKKQVNHVFLNLSPQNLTSSPESDGGGTKRVVVNSLKDHEFMIKISPVLMEMDDFKLEMVSAVHQAMVRVWLFNNAPKNVVNGIVKYISDVAVYSNRLRADKFMNYSEDMDEDEVAKYLSYCEMHVEGFVRRLNQEMKDGWRDEMIIKNCKMGSSSSQVINTTSLNLG